MDAETVALLGDGSPDEGARRLYELRSNLRRHKGKQLSKGKFSTAAKAPEDYLRLAKGGKIRVTHTPMIGDQKLAYSAGVDAANRVMRQKGLKEWDDEAWAAATDAFNKVMGEPPVKKAKGGRILRALPGGLPPRTDAERKAELESVQRFLKVFREKNPPAKVAKAKGGAVENMTRFAEELEQTIQAGNSDRITQITAQMDSLSPKSSVFFQEGFAKGGKAKDLLTQFMERMQVQSKSPVPIDQIAEELRRMKPDSEVLRLYESGQRRQTERTRNLEGEELMRLLEKGR